MADPGAGSARRTWCSMPERVQLHLAMLALQFGYAGFHVVSRAALNMGISKIVFIVYRNVIAFLLLAPFAYFLEKKERPAITLNFLVQFFLLALVGITANQGFYLLGLDNTSPTFASAIQNSVPAITFLMAAVLRIEKVRLDRKDGIAKILGTAFCVIGASVITLYKGPVIYNPKPPLHVASPTWQTTLALGDAAGKNWTLGCVYLIGHCLSWSGWLVLQAPVLKKYPARLSVTSYTCFFGLLQFLVISAFIERNSSAWLVHTGAEVFSIFYADHRSGPDHSRALLGPVGEERGAQVRVGEGRDPVRPGARQQPPTGPHQGAVPHSAPPPAVHRERLTAASLTPFDQPQELISLLCLCVMYWSRLSLSS
ncbi:hypothetical protein EUGRSUZ_F01611 [Eucalyptus grandis]|uniref:WAT1-related protein n=2 Tax=Eucalyptus grandis TaxID=71139 RepID=A0A059BQA1_EUCGR|nr:hypothetical protein EUGRSUZ_F01611 [Eucalyptus grandis]